MEQFKKHKKIWILLSISIFLYLIVLRPIISDSTDQMNTSGTVTATDTNSNKAGPKVNNTDKLSQTDMGKSDSNNSTDSDTNEGNHTGGDNEYVYVTGAVEMPGLYRIKEGETVGDVILGAGGLLPYASVDTLNLAEIVSSGSHIHVTFNFIGNPEELLRKQKANINTASEQELTKLSGIGPGTAKKIIAYREQSGPFKAIEDLKKVKGIGEVTFKKLAPHITI